MTPYEELRRQAAEKRDRICAAARQEYRAAVRRIQSLHKLVEGKPHPMVRPPRRAKDKTLADMLLDVLPKDRPFTIAQACELVYAEPLGTKYRENSIRAQFPVLVGRGIIHKVGRRSGHVLWARKDSGVEVSPFVALSMPEIAEQLIQQHGPMRIMEIVIRMKELGHRPHEDSQRTYTVMRSAMARIGGRFKKLPDGRWGLVS